MLSVDPDAQPEPAIVTRQVPRSEVEFPVMADAATRQAEGSQLRVDARGDAEREVLVGLPDSGAQVRFAFKAMPCWTLVGVNDESM